MEQRLSLIRRCIIPYQTTPTFSSGNILTASDLNILSNNLDFLNDLLGGVNPAFAQVTLNNSGSTSSLFNQLHRAQYFHYNIQITSGTHDTLSISYNGTTVFSDAGSRTAPYTWQGYVDLNSNPGGLTLGNFYDVQFNFSWQSGGTGAGKVVFLGEYGSTTSPI